LRAAFQSRIGIVHFFVALSNRFFAEKGLLFLFSTITNRVSRLYEPPGTIPYARWCERAEAVRHSPISIRDSAGNPHATFCGSRRRATASGGPVTEGASPPPTRFRQPPRDSGGYGVFFNSFCASSASGVSGASSAALANSARARAVLPCPR
jgi:hypothetical protein